MLSPISAIQNEYVSFSVPTKSSLNNLTQASPFERVSILGFNEGNVDESLWKQKIK